MTIEDAARICRQMEADKYFNLSNKRVLRGKKRSVNEDGAQFIFNKAHMFEDYGWAFVAVLFKNRFCHL
jgi:hypothetical protein